MNTESVKILNDMYAVLGVQTTCRADTFDDYERILFAMTLRRNSILDEVKPDYFDNENLGMLVEIAKNIREKGTEICFSTLWLECGRLGLARLREHIPAPWFTVANKDFYIGKLKERFIKQRRKASLLDELRALDEEV
jgi:hypothetical protein